MKNQVIEKRILGGAKRQSRALVVLTMMLALVMNVKAQERSNEERMMEFQVMMAMHDTTYKNFIKNVKYKEAIAPLTALINTIDTTNIYKVANCSVRHII